MRLYVAKIAVVTYEDIVVCGENEEGVRKFLEDSNEWKNDATFEFCDGEPISVKNVYLMDNEYKCPWVGSSLPYGLKENTSDHTISNIFYNDILGPMNKKALSMTDYTEEELDEAWEKYFIKVKALEKQFNNRRAKKPGS